jgi:hypothetical protein
VEADVEERARAAWTRWWLARLQWWTRQVVGEALAVDRMVVNEATMMHAWRRLRSERTGGGEIIVARVMV